DQIVTRPGVIEACTPAQVPPRRASLEHPRRLLPPPRTPHRLGKGEPPPPGPCLIGVPKLPQPAPAPFTGLRFFSPAVYRGQGAWAPPAIHLFPSALLSESLPVEFS